MARFWIMSDLHQEDTTNAWAPQRPFDAFDAIIVAGDMSASLELSIMRLRDWCPTDRIVYVAGNHDYWQDPGLAERRMTMDEVEHMGRLCANTFDVDLLIDSSIEIAGARILGSTLWTDYRVENLCSQMTAMHTCGKKMNDHRMIRRASSTRPTKPIRPEDLLLRHRASVAFLDAEMALPFDGPTVVVTHHAPHPLSLTRRGDDTNPAYASDLTDLIGRGRPHLWIHGHVHSSRDYVVGNTRIVCNPRGYRAEDDQQAAWRRDWVVTA